jgi:tRNA(Arg) A34 adenosine deaminase TadA
MSDHDDMNRRDFMVTTASVAGSASALAGVAVTSAQAQTPRPPVLDEQSPLAQYWKKQVFELAAVDLKGAAPELASEAVRERHQIYSFLLMKLIHRFWNGNKHGPLGDYPRRVRQREAQNPTNRFRGDMIDNPDDFRVNWDRYLGHNIACLAVDGNGEIIDFDFNHNDFFRSSAEHAESRMVRRLFSLTNVFDNWKTGEPINNKSRAFSLKDVTLYTSLESCAQCSGVMSLARVKQVVYLQNDPGAYVIGNIMFNLAGQESGDKSSLAAIPIPASAIGLPHLDRLNTTYAAFFNDLLDAKKKNDASRAFYISPNKTTIDYEPSITSFLCTDAAREIFDEGGRSLDAMMLKFPDERIPNQDMVYTNKKCLDEARRFFDYADMEGYRGSPHKQ